ncbi:hypothetical protein LAV84_25495 [Rhizobium sp. VS19-DR104.2]|uniref:hypothetical protein n=1 Tax=unclassified Rhizobium TaxID=2613769 RepID=UPI001C5ACA7A|nr:MULTISPECIES: hypothetical protein [unclassified Rhizobium]MBZ5762894.1 hypothetical protein [Rhizobium sp. VS19-DR96]MBZ5768741.1 hypothetical protein [Rhizobium sp. VS19-DR129.2]MBZ5776314.1 hypothetical protein [Rhizobium sp. VS19-DRK62.2]MBZ5787479.1 hypothetical protein [Rhizobium sp. VS19-DR121]MBZ5804877.1 hypothetical protein [Rhizobium sp. VS19-DR181]
MEQLFYETEALEAMLSHCAEILDLDIDPDNLVRHLAEDEKVQLNNSLCSLFSGLPEVEVSTEVLSQTQARHFAMRISQTGPLGAPTRMKFFKVKPAANTIAINLVGFLIAAVALQPSAFVSALNIMKSIADNLVTLKSPADDLAMRLFEMIVKKRIQSQAEEKSIGSVPTADLLSEAKSPETDCFIALARLKDLGLIDAHWAGISGDVQNKDNMWRTTI